MLYLVFQDKMDDILMLFDPSLEDETPSDVEEQSCSSTSSYYNSKAKCKWKAAPSTIVEGCGSSYVLNNTATLDTAKRKPAPINMLDKYNDWATQQQAQQASTRKNTINTKSKNTNVNKTCNSTNNNANVTMSKFNDDNLSSNYNTNNNYNNSTNNKKSIKRRLNNNKNILKRNISSSSNYNSRSRTPTLVTTTNITTTEALLHGSPVPIKVGGQEDLLSKDALISAINKDPKQDIAPPLPDQLPSEPQEGNIEYKLKLLNPNQERFKRLVSQVSGCVVVLWLCCDSV